MEEYENEMFKFLTQEENFKALVIAKNQFNGVKNRLITNFWGRTYQVLKDKMKDKPKADKTWNIKLDENIFGNWSKLYIYDQSLNEQKNKLPSFSFAWERLALNRPYYGFWINMESTDFRVNDVMEFLKCKKSSLFPLLQDYDGEWWPFWDFDSQLDFNDDSTLTAILPANLENKANENADLLVDIFDNMQEVYQEIIENFKNVK